MNQDKIKRALCETHADLLHIILYFGGFMLLAQLRALCLAFGLYASGQAVNRAVRELRKADILNRQTWVDNNSDLLLARKYAYRFFGDATSQEVATPRRPSTMAPYIIQARKIDWLLNIVQRKGLTRLLRKSLRHFYGERTGGVLGAGRPAGNGHIVAGLDRPRGACPEGRSRPARHPGAGTPARGVYRAHFPRKKGGTAGPVRGAVHPAPADYGLGD